ncbi:MAG: V-type ATP synthase subunit I [Streptococcaceae bacterium]|jgi:V/A-type H+-transporting ATPase subunit I|nr:V-type ATP synthase subunit I [Streptococcaceae bacterium]
MISKMTRFSLLMREKNSEIVLQTLQELQAVEIVNTQLESEFPKRFFFQSVVETKTNESIQMQLTKLKEKILRVQQAITFVERNGKSVKVKRRVLSFGEIQKAVEETSLFECIDQIEQLSFEREELLQEMETLRERENFFSLWRSLDVDMKRFSHYATVRAFSVSFDKKVVDLFLKEMHEDFDGFHSEVLSENQNDAQVFLLVRAKYGEELRGRIEKSGGQILSYHEKGKPLENYHILQKQKERNQKALKKIQKRTMSLAEDVETLYLAEENLLAEKERLNIRLKTNTDESIRYIEIWVGELDAQNVHTALQKLADKNMVVIEEVDTKEMEVEKYPIQFRNNRLVQPFENLTAMYALPKYDEIDPTPWMTPFYFVFFGMMVADIGYGLVLLFATTLALKTQVFKKSFLNFVKFFQILSIPTIIWGFIYSSFFGANLPKNILSIPLPFPLISTTRDVNTILILSLAFGFLQILTGLGLSSALHLKKKNYVEMVTEGFAWQGVLIGGLMYVLGEMILGNSGIAKLGIVLAVLSTLCIILGPTLQSKKKGRALVKGLYNFYGISGYIGDLVSYTRLMALGISGGSIAAAFNLLVGFLPTPLKWTIGILLIVVLQSLNLFLSYLGAYVHSARLQYVEFFGKFYQGGGRALEPFKMAEKHFNFENKSEKE